ncbi:cysteine desulfurase family protein [Flavobacterium algicola]|uniref:cysteine desulfurase family protein n=1 Tax=Flavobacterium algicola TaxID=556529 RepID=UPI001EFDF969|nr:cysteine desulfurase family protein [Flavobacterium algicola]MCG9793471.1 cysteine desulfurase [Flavobacterium algicola]
MKKIYLDNASTTSIRPEVVQEMTKIMLEDYGNPSSTHSLGRHSKSILELSRKAIAKSINATAAEIIFTSSATEANNWILRAAVTDIKVTRIITSRMEHHAVLHVIQQLKREFAIEVEYVKTKLDGTIDLTHLVELLSGEGKTLVSLMHVNNETGVILDLERVGMLCREYGVLFHSDTVQSIGKIKIDLQSISIDFLVASAHKFHGPKGIGFAFVKKNSGLQPLIYGGEQEKGLRAGTEPVHQIAGMAKALTMSIDNQEAEMLQIAALKCYLIAQLTTTFPDATFNGGTVGIATILNVLLPFSKDKTAMILFHLDMKGIAVSRGSACQSGSIRPSHVLAEMLSDDDLKKPNLRISLSHYNTIEDIDGLIDGLKSL